MFFGLKNNWWPSFSPNKRNHLARRGFWRHVFAFFHFFRGDRRKSYLGLPQSVQIVSYALQREKTTLVSVFPNMRNHLAQSGFWRHVSLFPKFSEMTGEKIFGTFPKYSGRLPCFSAWKTKWWLSFLPSMCILLALEMFPNAICP